MQRVVFNSHYLAYCDDASESFVRARGIRDEGDAEVAAFDFMVKKAVVEWQGSATVADELDIAVSVSRWGNSSFDLAFAGAVEERPVFTATITYVGVLPGTTETAPPPAAAREAMGAAAP